MRGRGKNSAHKQLDAESRHAVDHVSMDYCFFGLKIEDPMPVLLVRHHRSKLTEAVSVSRQGGDPRVIGEVVSIIRRLGVRRVVFKCDHENSILEERRKVTEALGEGYEVLPEPPPVGEHQSNRVIERAVDSVGGMARILRASAEDDTRQALDETGAVIPWIIKHAAVWLTV